MAVFKKFRRWQRVACAQADTSRDSEDRGVSPRLESEELTNWANGPGHQNPSWGTARSPGVLIRHDEPAKPAKPKLGRTERLIAK